ncbi:MAG: tripartite tricarboxylate transporter substrate binding protein [Xanthobacteraceae bacterium]
MITRRRTIALAATAALAPGLARRAPAQSSPGPAWPTRFVRLVAPLAPGGPTDFVARLVAEPLSKSWGQQVVIENKPGGGTNIANELVARSDPDGYTILYATSSLAVNRSLYRSLGYDPIADLAPVVLLTAFPFFMFVPNSSPAKSVKDFIAFAKANPGKLTLASPGTGSAPHLTGELFKRMAELEMTHVPYRGAGPVLNDLIPGRVDLYFGSGALLESARTGQIRGLAVTGAQREPAAPDLPTIAETLPGFEVSSWQGLFVPAKTSSEIVAKINADARAALADPLVKGKLEQLGYKPIGSTPEALAALLKSDINKWGAVIKDAGIAIQ